GEGTRYIGGTLRLNVSVDEVSDKVRLVRSILEKYPEVEAIVPAVGRPDDGTDPTGFYNLEIFVPLKPQQDWPELVANEGLLARWWPRRPRTKDELVYQMNAELDRNLPGVDWDFSQYIRDNVMEALSGVKGENSVKIIGPDLEELEKVAEAV